VPRVLATLEKEFVVEGLPRPSCGHCTPASCGPATFFLKHHSLQTAVNVHLPFRMGRARSVLKPTMSFHRASVFPTLVSPLSFPPVPRCSPPPPVPSVLLHAVPRRARPPSSRLVFSPRGNARPPASSVFVPFCRSFCAPCSLVPLFVTGCTSLAYRTHCPSPRSPGASPPPVPLPPLVPRSRREPCLKKTPSWLGQTREPVIHC